MLWKTTALEEGRGQAWEWKRNLIFFIMTVEGRRNEEINSKACSTENTEIWT